MANKCKDCGCSCKKCNNHDVHLHVEIENLKQQLLEKENHIVTMETNFLNEANKFPSGELVALREELLIWQDKYRRLYDAHRRVQRVNQGLEDKLLKLVDVCETDKNTLTKDIATLSEKLSEANYTIKKLKEDNERYKTDVSLAIQFLQCKQTNFVAHKFNTLPQEVQAQVSSFLNNKKRPEEKYYEPKSIKVPIPTFPPTAMVYSVTKSPKPERRIDIEQYQQPQQEIDIVSAAIMAKVLEERQKEKACTKHCDTCTCLQKLSIVYDATSHTIGTQTGDYKNFVCLRCNDSMTLTGGGIKIVRDDITKNNKISKEQQTQQLQNEQQVVKVLPNNFLIEIEDDEIPPSSNIHLLNNEIKPISSFDRVSNQSAKGSPALINKNTNCSTVITATATTHQQQQQQRLESNNRNILLDNVHHGNISTSVLYKGSNKIKNKEDTPKTHHNLSQLENSFDDNVDNDDDDDDDSLEKPIIADNARYAEMEENVKRFLFGESELSKKNYKYNELNKNYDS